MMGSTLPRSQSMYLRGSQQTWRRLENTQFPAYIIESCSTSLRPRFRIPFHVIFTLHHSRSCTSHRSPGWSSVYTVNYTIRMHSSKNTIVYRTARNPRRTTQGVGLRRLSLHSCFGRTQHTSQTLGLRSYGQYTYFSATSRNTFDRGHPPVPAITWLTFPRCAFTTTRGFTVLLISYTASGLV